MTARLDQFVDVLLRERAEQLYLLPDEPVTIVTNGKPRKVTKQPLTDRHIYALLVEVAPSEAADKIDRHAEVEFDYAADRGLARIRVVPEGQRLTAVISPHPRDAAIAAAAAPRGRPSVGERLAPRGAPPRAPRPSAIAAAPFVADPIIAPPSPALPASAPPSLPSEFAGSQYTAAEQRLGAMLRALIEAGGSDLHLRVSEPPTFRINGELRRQESAPLTAQDIQLMLLAVMPESHRAEWKEGGDTDFAYAVEGLARFRCNAARERRGPAAVARAIPATIKTADDLGLPPVVRQLCHLPRGLVLVTGPTGAGKSTTLGALVDLINRERPVHVITIEDPIEFVHEPQRAVITQRQLRLHTAGWRSAVHAALREDPDVIALAELTTVETVSLALEAAEAGHLVLAAMRTNTAAATVDRLVDQFPVERQSTVRAMVADALKGVIAQVMCRAKNGAPTPAREILLVTPAVANLIREGKTFQLPALMQAGRKTGMTTLNEALAELVETQTIDPAEAELRAAEKTGMLMLLKQKGLRTGTE